MLMEYGSEVLSPSSKCLDRIEESDDTSHDPKRIRWCMDHRRGGRGITVNAIRPGWVDTAMANEGMMAAAQDMNIIPEAFRKIAEEGIPTKRFTEAREVGTLAAYLASEASDNTTGQALNLWGGATTA